MKTLWGLLWIGALGVSFTLGLVGIGTSRDEVPAVESFREAFDQRNLLFRSHQMSRFLSRLQAENVAEVIEFVEARQRWFDERDLLLVMTAWTRFDESRALDWALAREGHLRRRVSAAAIEAVALRNPIGARSVVDSRRDSNLAVLLHDRLIQGWARSEFKRDLTDYVMLIERKDQRLRATSILVLEISKQGTEELVQWAEAIPDDAHDGYKRVAFREVAEALAIVDPTRARDFLQPHLEDDYAADAVPVLMQRWTEEAMPTALHWLVSLPELEGWQQPLPVYEQWQETLTSIFSKWLRKAPMRAEAFVRFESPSAGADPLVRALVRHYFSSRPGLALDWAYRIHDPQARMDVQIAVGRSWFEQAPGAFRAWLPNSGLEPSIRDAILNAPQETEP